MKSITNILNNAELTPRERVLLVIQDEIHQMKHDKYILSDAQKNTLYREWRPKTKFESDEAWRNMQVWDEWIKLHTAFQMKSLQVLYRLQRTLTQLVSALGAQDNLFDTLTYEKGLKYRELSQDNLLFAYSGISYHDAIYTELTVLLNEETKRNLSELDDTWESNYEYLMVELALYEAGDDIEKLTHVFFKRIEYMFENTSKYINNPQVILGLLYDLYIGGYPAIRFLETLANHHDVDHDNIEALVKIPNLKDEIQNAIRVTIENGMLEENTPLYKSEETETYNNPTSKPHSETFAEWKDGYCTAKDIVDSYIKSYNLTVTEEIITSHLIPFQIGVEKIITGDSIITSGINTAWVTKYRKVISGYKMIEDIITSMSTPNETVQYIEHIKSYISAAEQISKFFEKDITFLSKEVFEDTTQKIDAICKITQQVFRRLNIENNKGVYFLADKIDWNVENYKSTYGEQEHRFWDRVSISDARIKSEDQKD